MRIPLVILLFLLFGLPGAFACEELVGRWEGEKRPRGLGQTFDFQNNGVVFIIVGAMMDGTYTLDASGLTLRYPDPANQNQMMANRFAMTLDGRTMHLTDAANHRDLTMTRVGNAVPGKPSYVGVWASLTPEGSLTTTRLESDGSMVYRVPMTTVKGRYVCANGEVTLEAGKASQLRKYHVEGSTLTFEKTSKSDEKIYHRVE
ncbi:MAG: hypothetical protein ABI718_16925 [Acidobacteriota bacterium]